MSLLKVFVLLLMTIGLYSEAPVQRIYPVEVKSYLLSDQQLIESGNLYAKNQQLHFNQWTFHQLKGKPTFLVIFAKNQGEAFVSGILKGKIGAKTFEVTVFGLPKDMEESAVWVIPVGNVYLGEGSALPQIIVEWKEFEAK